MTAFVVTINGHLHAGWCEPDGTYYVRTNGKHIVRIPHDLRDEYPVIASLEKAAGMVMTPETAPPPE